MDCVIDWMALPVLVELHSIDDVERLINDLYCIKGFDDDRNT